MIKSEREYTVTKNAIEDFVASLEALKARATDDDGYRASLSSLEAQLEDLRSEVTEWETLRSGGVEDISIAGWADLPKALIRARIAQGLTQTQLAERLGLKKQQVQRWEDEEYEHAEFWRVLEAADALGLSLTCQAKLPEVTRPALDAVKGRLKRVGMDAEFVEKCLVPRPAGDDSRHLVDVIESRIAAIWNINLPDLMALNFNDTAGFQSIGIARFKRPANAKHQSVSAYEGYSACILSALCDALPRKEPINLPSEPRAMRRILFGNEAPSFRRALNSLWRLGIPVLPIPGKGGFHAACYRFEGRPAIAVKQTLRSPARWLFDLAHELGHLAEDKDPQLMVIETVDRALPQDFDAEQRAHDFAANALLGQGSEKIFPEVWGRAGGHAARLKQVTLSLADELHLDVGLVAQHVAFRAGQARSINWWGTARNLESTAEDPFETAREVLLSHLNPNKVAEPARGMLLQVLDQET